MSDVKKRKKKVSKRRKQKRLTILAIILDLVLLLGIIGVYSAFEVLDQVNRAKTMKASAETLASSIKALDAESAQTALDSLTQTSAEVRESLDEPLWKLASSLPMLKTEFGAVNSMLDILDDATQTLLQPGVSLLQEHPLKSIQPNNTEAIDSYAGFIQTALPKVEELVGTVKQVELGRINDALGMMNLDGKVDEMLDTADGLITTVNHYAGDIINSATELMKQYPIGDLKKDNSFNVVYINKYIDYAESILPQIRNAVTELKTSSMADNKQMKKYLETAEMLLQIYDDNPDLVQLAKNLIGKGENKRYLLVAMNSSEIRALGGFPGAMGTLDIKDGIMTIGDFESVYNVLDSYTAKRVNITQEEINIFQGGQNGLELSWDACLCPDFLRVVDIWTASYYDHNGVELDGIIALTPTVIQKILEINGATIKLSDGTKLKGSNATHQLQYDLYFKYFQKGKSAKKGNDAIDKLFAETANKTLTSVFKKLKPEQIPQYLDMAHECFDERIIMMWMKDPKSQSIIENLGWDGALNNDPQNPQAGVYFNCIKASKMGWFAEIKTDVGVPTINADASRTYPVTVKISNIITQEEIDNATTYIIGKKSGDLECNMLLFAPAGGSMSNFQIAPYGSLSPTRYHGRQVYFLNYLRMTPGQEFTITYNVTTAPGVTTPLTINQTPSLTEFH